MESDFGWFSKLGFPDVATCPYVKIADGNWTQVGEEAPPRADYSYGFLLGTNGPVFRALTVDLREETLTNRDDKTNEYKSIGFKGWDLKAEADAAIQSGMTPSERDEWSVFPFRPTLSKRAQLFVLGWACWRQELTNEAEGLYEQSRQSRTWDRRYEGTNTFRELVERDIAYTEIWRATLCFGDLAFSRPQLLAMFDAIATNYPDSEYHKQAAQTTEMLRRMIAEDKSHAKIATIPLAQLPVEAQVRELIFELRDQNGHQYSQPGWCDIFDEAFVRGNTNTPAHRLVRLGYAAVPQLIAALDDPTLTRSVGYWRNFRFSHTVLTVGDCSEAILDRISGRSFFVPGYTSSYMSKDQMSGATKKSAEAWWAEFQRKGEEQMLIDEVSSPGNDAPGEAEILCRKYPDAAAPALISGIKGATNDWIRAELIRRAGTIRSPEVTDFLTMEMTNSPDMDARIAAADVIIRTDKKAAVTVMINEWEEVVPQPPGDDDGPSVAGFLASSDSPEAIAALARGMQRQTAGTRIAIIQDFDLWSLDPWSFGRRATNSPATRAAIEALLVSELRDTEEQTGYSGSMNGKDFFNPRVCDMAGFILMELFTNRYAFNLSATRKVRDRQRIECINTWRKAHHLPSLPLPAPSTTHVKPEQAAWVMKIEWANDSVRPSHEFAEKIAAFEGQRLEATNLVELLRHYVIAPESNAAGLEFEASRDEDLTGVKLVVRLIPGRQLTSSQMYQINEGVTLGRDGLVGISEIAKGQLFTGIRQWTYFSDAVTRIVDSDPETPFQISVGISAGVAENDVPTAVPRPL